MTMATGLCLSGGADRGAFQIGVLDWLVDHPEVVPDGFVAGSGTSVGAIHIAALAMQAPGPDQVRRTRDLASRCWERVRRQEDVWRWRFPKLLAGLTSPSVGDNEPLRRLLCDVLDYEAVRRGTPAVVGAWGLTSGRSRTWRLAETRGLSHLVSVLLASSSFPGVLPPEQVDGELYTDHGVVDIAPLRSLIGAGCDRIIVVLCRPLVLAPAPAPKTTFDLLLRCFEGTETELVNGDLREIELVNRLVSADAAPGKRRIEVVTIAPAESLGSQLDFSESGSREMRALGYEAAKAALGR